MNLETEYLGLRLSSPFLENFGDESLVTKYLLEAALPRLSGWRGPPGPGIRLGAEFGDFESLASKAAELVGTEGERPWRMRGAGCRPKRSHGVEVRRAWSHS